MRCKHLSASSISTFDMCEYSYHLAYDLGLRGYPNAGALKGTICHECLERTARFLMKDEKNDIEFARDSLDRVVIDSVFRKHAEDENNKKFVELTAKDFKECYKKIMSVLDSGIFDNEILGVERAFDIVFSPDGTPIWYDLKEDYDEIIEAGVSIEDIFGYNCFRILGFMDLVIKEDENTAHVYDYKTGKSTKSFDQAMKDTQCLMYALATSCLYPDYENIFVTLWFIDKKQVTVCYEKKDIDKFIDLLYYKWQKITRCNKPQRTVKKWNSWKCRYCAFKDGKADCDIFYLLESAGKDLTKSIALAKIGRTLEGMI